jgi:hypothetical protein
MGREGPLWDFKFISLVSVPWIRDFTFKLHATKPMKLLKILSLNNQRQYKVHYKLATTAQYFEPYEIGPDPEKLFF